MLFKIKTDELHIEGNRGSILESDEFSWHLSMLLLPCDLMMYQLITFAMLSAELYNAYMHP